MHADMCDRFSCGVVVGCANVFILPEKGIKWLDDMFAHFYVSSFTSCQCVKNGDNSCHLELDVVGLTRGNHGVFIGHILYC